MSAGPREPEGPVGSLPAELAPTEPRSRRWRRFGLQLAGSCVFLGIVFAIVDVDTVLGAIAKLPLGLWALVVALHCGLHVVQAGKWRVFARMAHVPMTAGLALRAHAAGQFGGIILPSLVGGDAVRVAVAVRQVGHAEAVVFSGLVDRLVDILGMLAIVAVGFALVPSAVQAEALGLNLAVVSALVLLGTGAWVGFRLLLRVRVLRRLPRPLARSLLRARRAVRAMLMHPGPAAAALVMSLFVQASFVVTALLVGDAMGLHLDVRIWFLIWPLAKMASMMPASLGGIGLLELAFRSLVAPFGDAEIAVAVALVMQTIRIALGLVSGAWWLAATRARSRGASPR